MYVVERKKERKKVRKKESKKERKKKKRERERERERERALKKSNASYTMPNQVPRATQKTKLKKTRIQEKWSKKNMRIESKRLVAAIRLFSSCVCSSCCRWPVRYRNRAASSV